MNQVRKFSITNAKGETVSLNNDEDLFAYSPEGLGVSFSNEYYGANGNFLVSSVALNQPVFSIRVLFSPEKNRYYQKYHEFIQFLNYQPLTLNYSIVEKGTFKRDCRLNTLTKTEINEWNIIDEAIELDFLTPWYQWIEGIHTEYSDQLGDGKIYINNDMANNEGFHIYDYVYEEQNEESRGLFKVVNDSIYMGVSEGSPLEITIYGGETGVSNPSWELYSGSELIQNDRYFIDIPPGYEFVVSSVPQNQFVRLIAPNGTVSNVYQSQDMTKTNFVTIPIGTYTLKLDTGAVTKYRLRKEMVVV
ncbi:phage distal tail protein domain-containing protein [Enterococcus sp. BWR-S5]|uniref:phage distal tail protein domain-containing protein n=1 Tax=Enterococcus sp. BWR-S5 TaxID=2787714 RepID=UPI001920FBED|nr:phage distal tail protein domain-containing protein [Enterococcus sp. BWR-S5]MBL1223738.1 phage baseplate protein [Enterococcus sp. BWR-S5]